MTLTVKKKEDDDRTKKIIGIVLGVLLGSLVVGIVGFVLFRRFQAKRLYERV